MRTVITIPERLKDRIPAAEQFVGEVAKHDPHWNGAKFEFRVGVFYGLNDNDEIAAAILRRSLGKHLGIIPS